MKFLVPVRLKLVQFEANFIFGASNVFWNNSSERFELSSEIIFLLTPKTDSFWEQDQLYFYERKNSRLKKKQFKQNTRFLRKKQSFFPFPKLEEFGTK